MEQAEDLAAEVLAEAEVWAGEIAFIATGLTGWQRAGVGPATYAPPAAAVTEQQELDALKNQADYFADALEQIKKRIEELEKSSK